MHPHTRWLELDLKHRGARRITTFCRRGDVKANQLDDDQTNRVILSSSSADVVFETLCVGLAETPSSGVRLEQYRCLIETPRRTSLFCKVFFKL